MWNKQSSLLCSLILTLFTASLFGPAAWRRVSPIFEINNEIPG